LAVSSHNGHKTTTEEQERPNTQKRNEIAAQ